MTKRERMETILRGEIPDQTPAGFWFHYPSTYSVQEMAEAHLDLYRRTDMDIIKIMQDFPYPIQGGVQTLSDWRHVKVDGPDSSAFRKMAETAQRIREGSKGEVMLFQTMFSPFKAADSAFGDALVMAHARENPRAVLEGVSALAEGLAEWAAAYLELGLDGIYYSAQFGEVGRFERTQWETLVKPSDLLVLERVKAQGGRSILHICGEPEYDFRTHLDWFADYPGDLFNWSVKDNSFSLEQGRELFRRPVLGGMNNKGNLISGAPEEIASEAQGILRSFGQKGFMLGADCTVQGRIDVERIRLAVEAAHAYRG